MPPRASDAYVETTFDGFAASFDAKLTRLGYRAPGLVADAVRLACGAEARGLRILDAGCGTGLCGPEVRPMAEKLVGVDLSGGMLEKAALTGAYDVLERAELTAYLAAHPGAFDVVLSADTLCYFGALEAFAEAALRRARAGRRAGLFGGGDARGRGGRLSPAAERPLCAQRRLCRPRARRGRPAGRAARGGGAAQRASRAGRRMDRHRKAARAAEAGS